MAALQQPERQAGPTRSTLLAETEQSLHRLFDAVYNEGDLGVSEEVVGANHRGHCEGTDQAYQGVSGLKAHAARLRATFPGLTVEVGHVYLTPDGFAARLTATGRFERALGGVQPSCRMGAAGEEPGRPRVTVAGVCEGS